MSFWSGETLLERLPRLVNPFRPEQIDCASYRLKIGEFVYISPTKKTADSQTKRQLQPEEGFVIPPGHFGLLITEEHLRVPKNALAFISIRSRLKFHGLVNVSGFHVDPGYSGRLLFAVFNAGPAPVHLSRGEDCFLIWYANLDQTSVMTKTEPGFSNLPSEFINPLAGKMESLAGLAKRVKKIESQHTVLKTVFGAILTVALTLWARDCQLQRAATQEQQSSRPPLTALPTVAPEVPQPAQSQGSPPGAGKTLKKK